MQKKILNFSLSCIYFETTSGKVRKKIISMLIKAKILNVRRLKLKEDKETCNVKFELKLSM